MTNNPVYKPYFIRSLNGFKPIIFIGFFAILFVGLLNGGEGIRITLLIGAGLLLITFINSLIKNVFFLRSIEINEETKIVTLTIYRFDYPKKRIEYNINDLKFEIQEIVVVFESYYLKIMDKVDNTSVFRQACVGGWNTKLFVEIIKKLDDINGTSTDISLVKGAYKHGNS